MSDVTSELPTAVDLPPETESLFRTGCRLFRRSEIPSHIDRPVPWLWHGYVARHFLTLLTGQWKIGKTTLLATLLARLSTGGQLAGREVTPGRAVVVTEEGAFLWLVRMTRHDIGDGVSFAFAPYVRAPLPRQWGDLIEDLRELHRRRPIDLVVIDPLAAMLPGHEEANAAAMTAALRPVRELAASGPGVLLVHHPRKGRTIGGQGARGTGALAAMVDFLVEVHWAGPATEENRRRRLVAWSRHEATPRRVLVELSADGTEYAVLPDGPDAPADVAAQTAETIVRAAGLALTPREVWERWPAADRQRPKPRTVEARLRGLAAAGRLERVGPGTRFEPFRYRAVEARSGLAP
ncbi:MAG TPA: AAA family ATPase [Gemmataceae bacterium]|jgi:hypothetical protein